MTTYAIVITFVLGIICGVIVVTSYEAWTDGRELKAKHRKAAELYKSLHPELASETDADAAMDEAVALVQDKLGGTILDYSTS